MGAGTVDLWRWRHRSVVGGIVLAIGIVITAWWANRLLAGSTSFYPALGTVILVAGSAVALFAAIPIGRRLPRLTTLAAGLGLAVLLAAPVASTLYTVNTAYAGSLVSAGPALAASSTSGSNFGAGLGQGQSLPATGGPGSGGSGRPSANAGGGQFGPGTLAGGGGGGGEATADSALVNYLVANRGSAAWLVAVSGSGTAASIELSTGEPVMAMGGFNGSDPAPTLAELQANVASGQLRFLLIGGQSGPGGSNGSASAISSWVVANGTVVDYGGSGGTLYDLSGATITSA